VSSMTLLIDLRGGHFFICPFPLLAVYQSLRKIRA
jgi:TusA-related sulfurtransferase